MNTRMSQLWISYRNGTKMQTWYDLFTNCLFDGGNNDDHVAHFDASLTANTEVKKTDRNIIRYYFYNWNLGNNFFSISHVSDLVCFALRWPFWLS